MSARARCVAAVLGLCPGAVASAQSLAARVTTAPEGDVRLAYSSRPVVSDNGRSSCDTGPVRLTLRMHSGRVTGLRTTVGGGWAPRAGVTDLGRVAAPEAAGFLLALAQRSDGEVGSRAISAAALADSVTLWSDLLGFARDGALPGQTRREAVFWVSQAAEQAATRGLDSLIGEETVDREIREQAVFALSQRPQEEGVPALIRIARGHRDPEIRRRAIFWLGQSNDARALALFEELLTRP